GTPTVSPFGERLAARASQAGAPSVVASSGSGPAIAAAISAQSSADRANGPTVSSVNDRGSALARLTRPLVGLKPVTPQKCAGNLRGPGVGGRSGAGGGRAAPAAPEPDDEPPVMRLVSHGLCALPR